MYFRKFACAVAVPTIMLVAAPAMARERWTADQAETWYTAQPWPVGSDYIPANAINQLEMWQADTFDPKRIDLELGPPSLPRMGWSDELRTGSASPSTMGVSCATSGLT